MVFLRFSDVKNTKNERDVKDFYQIYAVFATFDLHYAYLSGKAPAMREAEGAKRRSAG